MALKAALILPAVLMIGAGALELTRVQAARAELQDIADTAASAAVTPTPTAADAAEDRARSVVEARLADLDEPDLTVQTAYEVTAVDGRQVIEVRLDGHRPSFLISLLPPGGWRLKARSTAAWDPGLPPG